MTLDILPPRDEWDPEMEGINSLLRGAGLTPHQYDSATGAITPPILAPSGSLVITVECRPPDHLLPANYPIRIIDHHALGDPGYGVPPAEYLRGSSLGQVIQQLAADSLLPETWPTVGPPESPGGFPYPTAKYAVASDALWCVAGSRHQPGWRRIPQDLLYVAAADHCLLAAYAGECPGISPAKLLELRAAGKAAHQKISLSLILEHISIARATVRAAPWIDLGNGTMVKDLRPCAGARCGEHGFTCSGGMPDCWGDIPELPDAAAIEQMPFIAMPRPAARDKGRRKVVLQCARISHLTAWPQWAKDHGLVDLYGGDPMRGFAGGYLP